MPFVFPLSPFATHLNEISFPPPSHVCVGCQPVLVALALGIPHWHSGPGVHADDWTMLRMQMHNKHN